jgi:hypothetical protein
MTEIARHHAALAAAASAHDDDGDVTAFVVAPTISFDEMTAREDFLLMLISTASGSILQRKNQKRALTILQGCGIQPEILDAADASNALVRDELCELSGMRGRYPQFFLVQGDQTQFFADFEELENMNEEGTLKEWLRMEIPCPSPARLKKTAEAPPSSPQIYSYAAEKCHHGMDDDDVTAETHQETSHASSSWDSYSAVQRQQHQLESFHPDPYEDSCHETNNDDEMYAGSDYSDGTDHQGFPLERLLPCAETEDSESDRENNHSHVSPRSPPSESCVLPASFTQRSPKEHLSEEEGEDFVSENVSNEQLSPYLQKNRLQDEEKDTDNLNADNLHSLNSLLLGDDDETVDTTATASSIVTNSRMTSMDLDLRIQPSIDIHFWLTHCCEDTSKCNVTLSNMSASFLPLAFRIQASQRRRYMVWPSMGVIKPQNTMTVTVVLIDDAKQELLDSFEKFGPAAEFRCLDALSIEWCGVPTDFCGQLTEDHDQDMETLMSYWNSCQKDEAWSCEQTHLRVRVSVDDNSKQNYSNMSKSGLPQRCIEGLPSQVSQDESPSHEQIPQALQAEVENLRRKCEELTAERYILEQQLEESREREYSANGGTIHKLQLQQTMRCGHCLKAFQADPRSLLAPIASQSCGHSICRNCCYRRSSRFKRRSRQTLSSDLLMCVGDLQSTTSFDDDSCPLCHAPSAFAGSKLHVNQSLCLVLKLLDS